MKVVRQDSTLARNCRFLFDTFRRLQFDRRPEECGFSVSLTELHKQRLSSPDVDTGLACQWAIMLLRPASRGFQLLFVGQIQMNNVPARELSGACIGIDAVRIAFRGTDDGNVRAEIGHGREPVEVLRRPEESHSLGTLAGDFGLVNELHD